jgi:peptide/nickel transport system permease protein
MGTDELGRDIFTRMLYGGRVTLSIGMASVLISLIIGVALGLIAGFQPRLDPLIMGIMDVLLAFPGILLALAVVAVLGPGLFNAMIAIGIFSVPVYARLVRAGVLSTKSLDYIEAARAGGATDSYVAVKHVIPNVVPQLGVLTSFRFAVSILSSASLSFLGLGAQPPHPEWGLILSQGRPYARIAPWIVVLPGLVITVLILSLNILGDFLRDYLDPRVRSTLASSER